VLLVVQNLILRVCVPQECGINIGSSIDGFAQVFTESGNIQRVGHPEKFDV
jgi:hypothetical protein